MTAGIDDAAVARLGRALEARVTAKARAFWNAYMKGAAAFRGVPMAGIREAVHAWWAREGLGEAPAAVAKAAALRLFEEEPAEDRLAGVLALAEIVRPHLGPDDLPSLERLFARGRVADWNLCDWLCVKVLARMVADAEAPEGVARRIAAWSAARPLWQRRASCVTFVPHAKHGDRDVPGLPSLVIEACARVVESPERFAQTGVGWVLRELSLFDRSAVADFARRHLDRLSREGMHYLTEKMPAGERRRLLRAHGARPTRRRISAEA